jgi:hypothetical protein
MRVFSVILAVIACTGAACADDSPQSRIDSIAKSARDLMPAILTLPSVSLPSMPNFPLPDFRMQQVV